MKEELLRLDYIDVKYYNSLVLKQFSMELYKGDVLGIYTKNFSETECLIDTIYGNIIPDSGRILYNSNDFKIVVVSKKSQLIESFSVAENIFVIRKGFKKKYINKRKLEFQATLMLEKLGLSIYPKTLIKNLSKLEKILVEISRAYILRIPVVIFKNLSGFLSDHEIKELHDYMETYRVLGLTFIILDSTGFLMERFCNRVLLLNKGRNIWTFRPGEFSENILSNFFKVDTDRVLHKNLEYKGIKGIKGILVINNLSTDILKSLSFKINKGEILGLVDLEGIQLDELKDIFLSKVKYSGDIIINGSTLKVVKTEELLKKGLAIIDEDPTKTTLFSEFNAIDNLALPISSKVPFFWQNKKYRKNIISKYRSYFTEGALLKNLNNLDIRELHSLSYLKWHLYSPDVIILIKPFSSVDRQLEDLTITLIDLLIQKGVGIVILTSNLWELSRLSTKQDITIQRLSPLT